MRRNKKLSKGISFKEYFENLEKQEKKENVFDDNDDLQSIDKDNEYFFKSRKKKKNTILDEALNEQQGEVLNKPNNQQPPPKSGHSGNGQQSPPKSGHGGNGQRSPLKGKHDKNSKNHPKKKKKSINKKPLPPKKKKQPKPPKPPKPIDKKAPPKNNMDKVGEYGLSFFRPRVVVEVNGFNQIRLLNELKKQKFKIYSVNKKSSSILELTVRTKDCEELYKLLEKLGYEYKVQASTNVKPLISFAVLKIGIVAGIFIFVSVFSYLYNFIWKYDITGNDSINSLVIERVLKEEGIGKGAKKNSLDIKEIRKTINAIDGILECTVEIKGITLLIDVIEETETTQNSKGQTYDIISNYDAEITKIISIMGTCEVKQGQRVFKNTTLIGAYLVDIEGNKTPSLAKGQVYGNVVFYSSVNFGLKEEVTSRTGRKKIKTDYKIFGGSINSKKQNDYEMFEIETEEFYVFQNTFVPLKAFRTTYYEIEKTEIEYTLQERIEYYKAQFILDKAINAGSSDIEIKTNIVDNLDGTYKLVMSMQAELLIGESK